MASAIAPGTSVKAGGMASRAIAAVTIGLVVVLLPAVLGGPWPDRFSKAAIFAIIGLSINVITGHAGQISLGHQAFVGIGAFASAYLVSKSGVSFFIAFPLAGITGGLLAAALGVVALRIRGLYLALITLAFGLMAQGTIFNIRSFTGGGEGAEAPRPSAFAGDLSYLYLCMAVLGFFLFVDWRLVKSKAGRAIVSVRNDERVASTLGINVVGYKLTAFVLGGFIAGVAGSLLGHRVERVTSPDFELSAALVWIAMSVVGGLGSRAGVVLGSAFFAIFDSLLPTSSVKVPAFLQFIGPKEVLLPILTPLVGALLLVLTVTMYPGGIAQQILPLRRWLSGGPFLVKKGARPLAEIAALTGDQLPEEIGAQAAEEEAAAESHTGPDTRGDA